MKLFIVIAEEHNGYELTKQDLHQTLEQEYQFVDFEIKEVL